MHAIQERPDLPVRIGVLGTGGITRLAVPQMRQAATVEIVAIASRRADTAQAVAGDLDIPRALEGYDELLSDTSIEAVYVALPIALHAEWTLKALRAGKHVLCEKPLAPTSAEVAVIAAEARKHRRLVWEGFMMRHHPQWRAIVDILAAGRIGKVRAMQGMLTRVPPNAFDPMATANRADLDGGVLLDSGCYMVHLARLAFGSEPVRVAALADDDTGMGVPSYLSAMLEFDTGAASFTVSSRLRRFQRVLIVGTEGSLDVRVPIMPHPARPAQVIADFSDTALTSDPQTLEFGPVPSFRMQAESFADAIRNGPDAPSDLQSSFRNAVVLEALGQSSRTGGAWTKVVADNAADGPDFEPA